jgi:hypothetical protein
MVGVFFYMIFVTRCDSRVRCFCEARRPVHSWSADGRPPTSAITVHPDLPVGGAFLGECVGTFLVGVDSP